MERCTECGKEFTSEAALSQHMKDKHGADRSLATKPSEVPSAPRPAKKPKSLRRRNRHEKEIAVAAVAVALVVGMYFVVAPSFASYPVPCVTSNSLAEHIHPYLRISIDNQDVAIPADVGFSASCAEPVHTHDASGILHVETGTVENVTLGQFFQIWAKWATMGPEYQPLLGGKALPVVFNSTDIFGFRDNATMAVTLLVNGSPYSGDPTQLILNEYDYCSASSSTPPCSPTAADSPPYYNGATYPWATGQTLVIEYSAKA